MVYISSKLFMISTATMSTDLTTQQAGSATGTTLKCLLQIAPTMGLEVVEWGVSFSGSAAATPGNVELCEVDVAASGGTAAQIPITFLNTAITSSTTSTISLGAALQGTAGPTGAAGYEIGTVIFGQGGATGTSYMEQMAATAGGSTTTLSVIRGANGTGPLASILVSAVVYGLPGTGVYSDVQPYSSQAAADPTFALIATPGTAATGYAFSTYNTPTRIRQGDFQLLPPTAPYVKQFPLERGFELHPGRFGQIRCTMGSGSVNSYAYVIVQA